MLGEHNITYRPRTSVKGQVLADFLAEMPDESLPAAPVVETQQVPWTLFTDGSSCMDGSRVRVILTSPEGMEFNYALRFQFAASNNEAEYEALIAEILKEKSIQEKEVTTVVEEDGPTWMTPIMEYLKEWTLPSDRKEARKLRIKARQYELLEGVLYRQSFLMPWLRCIGPLQVEYVIREIHERSCSMHAGPRSVVAEAIRLGYYWLTMHRDARDMIPGPFPEGPGKVKFLIVAMDDFTKWIEAKAVRQSLAVSKAPAVQWTRRKSKPELGGRNQGPPGRGKQELAVIPAKIRITTYHTTAAADLVYNDEELRLNLDLIEEQRERAVIHEAKAKLKMTKYYNVRVRGVAFKPDDFVYRCNDASHAVD
uniref:Reverse transcriptase domain-containing protein n=1 Tax=Tanacetum cinerariifolium TaxID=118510 RepID=A0A6L2L665_TANCI|nr:reverse transcriptase domain-containing protein [Tanacetum cinerariifolium]